MIMEFPLTEWESSYQTTDIFFDTESFFRLQTRLDKKLQRTKGEMNLILIHARAHIMGV
jgi:hypothetical protein